MHRNSSRSVLLLAVLTAISVSSQAFAADKSATTDNKTKPGVVQIPQIQRNGNNVPPPPPAPLIPTLTTVTFPAEIYAQEPILIKLNGINLSAGQGCVGSISWQGAAGYDGMLASNGVWRDQKLGFPKEGTYQGVVNISSTPTFPCAYSGPASFKVEVKPAKPLVPATISKFTVGPDTTSVNPGQPMNRQFDLQWDGTGGSNAMCSFTLNFGDGKSSNNGQIGGAWLPAKNSQVHTYTASGTYTASIVITGSTFGACSLGAGVTSLSVTIP